MNTNRVLERRSLGREARKLIFERSSTILTNQKTARPKLSYEALKIARSEAELQTSNNRGCTITLAIFNHILK